MAAGPGERVKSLRPLAKGIPLGKGELGANTLYGWETFPSEDELN